MPEGSPVQLTDLTARHGNDSEQIHREGMSEHSVHHLFFPAVIVQILDSDKRAHRLSEVSDNLVSSRERVVKLRSAPSHIPLCRAFTYLIDG